MRLMIVLAALLLATGCASVPMAPPDEDAAGKRFEPAPAGQAVLYVFRESVYGGAFSMPVMVGPRPLGNLAADTWFRVVLEPGSYEVRCNMETSASVPVQLSGGETRYVEAAIRFGLATPRCAMTEVNAATARTAILSGRRAQETR
jgi:hypothetical protein